MNILKDTSQEWLYAHAETDVVAVFAEEMKRKLKLKRRQGRDGWYTPSCKIEYLKKLLIEHIEKGDMVDVANFAMMIKCKEVMGHD